MALGNFEGKKHFIAPVAAGLIGLTACGEAPKNGDCQDVPDSVEFRVDTVRGNAGLVASGGQAGGQEIFDSAAFTSISEPYHLDGVSGTTMTQIAEFDAKGEPQLDFVNDMRVRAIGVVGVDGEVSIVETAQLGGENGDLTVNLTDGLGKVSISTTGQGDNPGHCRDQVRDLMDRTDMTFTSMDEVMPELEADEE